MTTDKTRTILVTLEWPEEHADDFAKTIAALFHSFHTPSCSARALSEEEATIARAFLTALDEVKAKDAEPATT